MSVSQDAKDSGYSRYLLLGSLTLNLLLAGAACAVALQHSADVPLQPVAGIKHGLAQRFDRIAASLPASDGKIIRTEFRAEAVKLASAEAQIRLSKEAVRDSLRAEPFDPAAMRAAMAETSTARDHFYQLVHDVVATATAKMSPAGRVTLADWPTRGAKMVVTQ
jgi:uncharacterized membrane protein